MNRFSFVRLPSTVPVNPFTFASRPALVLTLGWLLAAGFSHAQEQGTTNPLPVLYSQGDPTNDEQYLLQKLNQARMDPAAEGQRLAAWLRNTPEGQGVMLGYGVNPAQIASAFTALPAVPPLAFDPSLIASSSSHAADIAVHGGVGPAGSLHAGYDGSTPESRVQASGCPQAYAGENADSGFPSPDQIHAGYLVDQGVPDLGHRQNRMTGLYGTNVVGIGIAIRPDGRLIEIEDFGSGALAFKDDPAMLTGVVYSDSNADGQYDPGEGVAGVKVTMDGGKYYAVTSASGGYALPLVNVDGSNVDGTVAVQMTFPNGGVSTSTATVTRHDWSWGVSGTYRGNVEWNAVTTAQSGGGDNPPTADPVATLSGGGMVSRLAHDAVKVFVNRPAGDDASAPLDVPLQFKGNAVAGVDYKALPATVTIPAGAQSFRLKVKALDLNGLDRPAGPWKLRIKLKGVPGAQGKATVTFVP